MTAIVGPLEVFRDGQHPVPHPPPRDTMDPRYLACTNHHLACDCREAMHAEAMGERIAEAHDLMRAAEVLLAGHATMVYQDDGQRRNDLECQCVGCSLARHGHFVPFNNRRRLGYFRGYPY
ncbi:hypothetical protein [Rhodococcoides fascians]|uniref:hypothetical protein n=1 Tax=Rhodococcoides fascians TaxID=1828 RepID=UPI0005688818|nr:MULTISPECIES: hypothetical protein [Rhodococcus]OZE98105.1 hypothetical protein CH301_17330 [Rhodococcus sp. 15-1189-1-1a]OZF12755.1 hypothetical protein CH299_18015 [Rhodococcus sp. 14-2686-1-2]